MTRFGIFAAGALLAAGCNAPPPAEPTKPRQVEESESRKPATVAARPVLSPKEYFEVTLPSGKNWQIQKGEIGNNDQTYLVAAGDAERKIALTVMVLPPTPDHPDLKTMKAGWERGFLKKASRKKSAEDITFAGREAFKVTAAVDLESGESLEVIGILIVTEGRNFTISVAKPGENAWNDPEVQEFLKSFKLVEPKKQ